MTDTLLLVGAGFMGRGYVAAAHDLGLRTVLLDDDAWRQDHEHRVAHFLTPAGTTETHWLSAALVAADEHRPDGAVPFSEPHVLATAWVQERLGLPGPSLAAADASRNKAVQRALFARAGLPQPDHTVADSADAAADWSRHRYPVVVKPLRGMASHGVRRVADEDELRADLAGRDLAQQVLVEEYVDAPEYSWEGLVREGEVIFGGYTRKVTTGPPEFVELQHRLPWFRGVPGQRERLDGQVSDLVAAAGIRTGLVHLEFRDDGEVLLPMEFAVRTPGDHIMELMCRAYGHDFFASAIELALGREVRLPETSPRAAGVVFVPAPGSGRIEAIRGTEAAAARPEVVRIGQKKHVGDVVGDLRSSGDRVAHALLLADDDSEVEAAAVAVAAEIEVLVSDHRQSRHPTQTSPEPAAVEVAADGPVVVVCKWRPDMITALLATTPNMYLVLDAADRAKAEAAAHLAEAARAVYHVGSLDSVEELTGVAVDLTVRGVRVDHVLSFAEDGQLGAAHLRALLGRDGGTDPLTASGVRDKRMMKRLVESAGVPVARWTSLPTNVAFAEPADAPDVGFPAVVKPAYGFGTMGTTRVDSSQELAELLAGLTTPERLHSGHLIVERFVHGRELHIDALWSGGKPLLFTVSAYFAPRLELLPDAGNGGTERPRDGSYILPRQENVELYDRLRELNETVNGALAIDTAVTHMEVFETPDGELVFSETAVRLGGGWVPATLSAHFGRDIHHMVAGGLLRGHVDAADPAHRCVGGLHMRPDRAGTITAMPTDDEIRSIEGVLDWRRLKHRGDAFGLDHAMDWCLLLILGADTADELTAVVERVESRLRIEVDGA
jgi:biotin carboxylase